MTRAFALTPARFVRSAPRTATLPTTVSIHPLAEHHAAAINTPYTRRSVVSQSLTGSGATQGEPAGEREALAIKEWCRIGQAIRQMELPLEARGEAPTADHGSGSNAPCRRMSVEFIVSNAPWVWPAGNGGRFRRHLR